MADVMRRMRALRQPAAEPPAEYAFERWIEQSHNLPHALMRMGHSYARQHFNHRAELCFRAAVAAGHPHAENALAALPRTREGLIEAGSVDGPGRPGHSAHPIEPHHTHMEDGTTLPAPAPAGRTAPGSAVAKTPDRPSALPAGHLPSMPAGTAAPTER